jgi:cobalamin biosynthesis protein CobD/CbiB
LTSARRCLPSVPLSIHPVVLAGNVISFVTLQMTPERVYRNPALGFLGGIAFLVGVLSLFVCGGHLFLTFVQYTTRLFSKRVCYYGNSYCDNHNEIIQIILDFVPWISEVALVETSFSLQLLCTIALQMSRFLERSQLDEARSQLSWLCSRDPSNLTAEDLAGATLESLSVRS